MIEAKRDKNPTSFYRLKVAKKKRLTKTSFLLTLEVPAELAMQFYYHSGQYVSLRYDGMVRDYSIASAPHEPGLSFGLKMSGPRSFTDCVCQRVHIGDSIEVSPPKGDFILEYFPDRARTILAFAAGIGITPIFSHIKSLLYREPLSRCLLFYGNRSSDAIGFSEEIRRLQKQYPKRFYVYHFYSHEDTGRPLTSGRLNQEKVEEIINKLAATRDAQTDGFVWDNTDDVLICGPSEMIRAVANTCFQHGVPKRNIHFELYDDFNADIFEQKVPTP